jgi:hypothetical protein
MTLEGGDYMTEIVKKEPMTLKMAVPVGGSQVKLEWECTLEQALNLVFFGFLALAGLAIIKAAVSDS